MAARRLSPDCFAQAMGFNPFGDGRSILRAAAAHWKVAFCMAPSSKPTSSRACNLPPPAEGKDCEVRPTVGVFVLREAPPKRGQIIQTRFDKLTVRIPKRSDRRGRYPASAAVACTA